MMGIWIQIRPAIIAPKSVNLYTSQAAPLEKIVDGPTHGHHYTPTPNLMGVIRSRAYTELDFSSLLSSLKQTQNLCILFLVSSYGYLLCSHSPLDISHSHQHQHRSLYNVQKSLEVKARVLVTNREQQQCQGRDLGRIRIRGLPLVNRDDKQELDKSPPSIALPIYTTKLARGSHISMRVSMI